MASKKKLKDDVSHLEYCNNKLADENVTLLSELVDMRQELEESSLAHRETHHLYEFEKERRSFLEDDLVSVNESLTRAHKRIARVNVLGLIAARIPSNRFGCEYELRLESRPVYDLYITETADDGDDSDFIERFYEYDEALTFVRGLKGTAGE